MSKLSNCLFLVLLLAISAHLLGSCNFIDGNGIWKTTNTKASTESEELRITLNLSMGLVADYGATPWRTSDIKFGDSQMNLALDTGTKLLWATVSDCGTEACKVHRRIDTGQADFQYISDPAYPKTVDFGAWGKMTVKLGSIPILIGNENPTNVPIKFNASIDYSGSKFQYLAWGGGIGFPSDTTFDDVEIESLIKQLYYSYNLPSPEFSVRTDKNSKTGNFYIGYLDSDAFSKVYSILTPKTSADPELAYLWGTELQLARLGSVPFPDLLNSVMYLDTGSSRFKAEAKSIKPILDALLAYTDANGNKIFEPYKDGTSNQPYTGVKFRNNKGPSDFPNVLPDFEFAFPDNCNGQNTMTVYSLSPEQYSYQVQAGDRKGEWVAAFHILEGIPGLLVGSTFLDLVVTQFTYLPFEDDLVQGDITLYQKAKGEVPYKVTCESIFE